MTHLLRARGSAASRTLLLAAALAAAACGTLPRPGGHGAAGSLFDEGMERYNLGDARGAIPPLEEAAARSAESDSLRRDVELQLGRCYLETGDPSRAIVHFQRARDLAPSRRDRSRILEGLGDAYRRSHRHEEAIAAYRECLRIESDPTLTRGIRERMALARRALGRSAAGGGDRGLSPPPHPRRERPLGAEASLRGIRAVLSRRDWGAAPTRPNHDPMGPIDRMTIHHTALPVEDSSRAGVAAAIRQIQTQHMRPVSGGGRGWADIGYHFLVDPAGRVWEGRPLRFQGAHAGNHLLNRGNIGIVLLGNFARAGVPAPQEGALRSLVDLLAARYSIAPGRIYTHRELRRTECPGRYLQLLVERIRLERRAAATRASLPQPSAM